MRTSRSQLGGTSMSHLRGRKAFILPSIPGIVQPGHPWPVVRATATCRWHVGLRSPSELRIVRYGHPWPVVRATVTCHWHVSSRSPSELKSTCYSSSCEQAGLSSEDAKRSSDSK